MFLEAQPQLWNKSDSSGLSPTIANLDLFNLSHCLPFLFWCYNTYTCSAITSYVIHLSNFVSTRTPLFACVNFYMCDHTNRSHTHLLMDTHEQNPLTPNILPFMHTPRCMLHTQPLKRREEAVRGVPHQCTGVLPVSHLGVCGDKSWMPPRGNLPVFLA
jgi:hypothetical protein